MDRYDLVLTDANGESHGFVCDWSQGGAGLTIEKGEQVGATTAVSTKGNFGVRDVNDHQRIIQTDWSLGQGQQTYDREADSESAFAQSWCVDVDHEGELRCGPKSLLTEDVGQGTALIAIGVDEADRARVWAGFASDDALERLKYTVDGITWGALSGSGPDGTPVDFTSDGETLYLLSSSGVVYTSTTVTATSFSAHASNDDITRICYNAGYLYATKGSASAAAQLGHFDGSSPAQWSALSPDDGDVIGAGGETFGLVPVGTYVYWGVTNNNLTTVFRARYSSVADNLTLACVATFPTGFVGTCMTSYLDTVYVGGHWRGSDADTGIGAIYTLVGDTPALLTDVGTDPTVDNRVLSLTAYGRDLYFAAANDLWRWDLVKGGYSHLAGPLDSGSATAYADITWTGEWPMNALPGTEGPTLAAANPVVTGTAVASVADTPGSLSLYLREDDAISYSAKADDAGGCTSGIADTTGTTAEMDLPLINLRGIKLALGVRGSARAAFVYLEDPVWTVERQVVLCEGNGLDTFNTIRVGYVPREAGTLRLTLKDDQAKVYWNGSVAAEQWVGTAIAPSPAKSVWFAAEAGIPLPLPTGTVIIDAVRWSDDGAFASDSSSASTFTGIGLAAAGGKVYAACAGVGCAVVDRGAYKTTTGGETAPWLRSSRSSGNMPTVLKYFDSVSVSHEALGSHCGLACTAIVDGARYPLGAVGPTWSYDPATAIWTLVASTAQEETESNFPIGITGKNIQLEVALPTTSELYSPVVQETAVLFDPVPKTAKLHAYYLRVWESVECPDGSLWDESPTTCAEWLEEVANTTVTVSRPGRADYTGRIELLKNAEAAPSRSDEREGLYQIEIRELS